MINIILRKEKMNDLKRILRSIIILVCAGLFCMSGLSCIGFPGPVFADGWLKRSVIITVVDADTLKPVSDAQVTMTEPNYMQAFLDTDRIKKEKKYSDITDSNGQVKLLIWFGCSSETRWGIRKGSFSLQAGTVQVRKEGYEPFESEFMQLAGETSRSVNNKSPIKILILLTPLNTRKF